MQPVAGRRKRQRIGRVLGSSVGDAELNARCPANRHLVIRRLFEWRGPFQLKCPNQQSLPRWQRQRQRTTRRTQQRERRDLIAAEAVQFRREFQLERVLARLVREQRYRSVRIATDHRRLIVEQRLLDRQPLHRKRHRLPVARKLSHLSRDTQQQLISHHARRVLTVRQHERHIRRRSLLRVGLRQREQLLKLPLRQHRSAFVSLDDNIQVFRRNEDPPRITQLSREVSRLGAHVGNKRPRGKARDRHQVSAKQATHHRSPLVGWSMFKLRVLGLLCHELLEWSEAEVGEQREGAAGNHG